MKRLFTLVALVLPLSALLAQSRTTEEAKRVILGERNENSYPSNPKDVVIGRDGRPVYDERRTNYPSSGSRQGRINEINREYDNKIRSIRNNRTLSNSEKERIIRDLEQERNRRIREIDRVNNDRRYEPNYGKNNNGNKNKYKNKNKGNNGKHLGWQKGKGNPHRD